MRLLFRYLSNEGEFKSFTVVFPMTNPYSIIDILWIFVERDKLSGDIILFDISKEISIWNFFNKPIYTKQMYGGFLSVTYECE